MIDTDVAFYFDHRVTAVPYNGTIDIDEGSGAFTVSVPVGSYTLSTLATAIENALNGTATNVYTVSVNRFTRIFTISADAPFDLLTFSGDTQGSAIWDLIGFSKTADKTGASSYVGDRPSGKAYYPQFPLQSYIPKEIFKERNEAKKNVASKGTIVEVISFGIGQFYQFNIKYITSLPQPGNGAIRNNPTGLEDAIEFMDYITQLNTFEFIPDISQPSTFDKLILESTQTDNNGTGYRLKEFFDSGARDYYETGILKSRVVE